MYRDRAGRLSYTALALLSLSHRYTHRLSLLYYREDLHGCMEHCAWVVFFAAMYKPRLGCTECRNQRLSHLPSPALEGSCFFSSFRRGAFNFRWYFDLGSFRHGRRYPSVQSCLVAVPSVCRRHYHSGKPRCWEFACTVVAVEEAIC
jgi:hypothetical protein